MCIMIKVYRLSAVGLVSDQQAGVDFANLANRSRGPAALTNKKQDNFDQIYANNLVYWEFISIYLCPYFSDLSNIIVQSKSRAQGKQFFWQGSMTKRSILTCAGFHIRVVE
jgi:hypothetical protein